MAIPGRVRLIGLPIDVEVVSPRDMPTNDIGDLGAFNYGRLKIVLSNDQAPAQMRDSLLHEAFHAIFRAADLEDQKFSHRGLGVLATLTLSMLRDNPELVAYLTEVDDVS